MNQATIKRIILLFVLITFSIFLRTPATQAAIDGITGTTFNFVAQSGFINTPDGNTILMWGYANGNGPMQYPGPTLILNEGATITITLTNLLTVPVSIVFPGQGKVIAVGGTQGLLAQEAAPLGGTVQYTFTASNPGTYTYYSGTDPDLQVEMGLVGAIIVRPKLGPNFAYNHFNTDFKREYLFLLSEMDVNIHDQVALGQAALVDTTTRFPVVWFINGRAAPDTMAEPFVSWLPSQPYNCMPRYHPGEKVLIRFIGAGSDGHPLHTHGNHHRVIARDGQMLESAPGAGPDLGELAFTSTIYPGSTADAIFGPWTGDGLGWDVYGHAPGDPLASTECVYNGNQNPNDPRCDHGKPIPVALPDIKDLTPGMFWSGSPFLGTLGPLPPGQVTMNTTGALSFMWHSHNEKEITTNNIFPGGMLTMSFVEPLNVIIEPSNP